MSISRKISNPRTLPIKRRVKKNLEKKLKLTKKQKKMIKLNPMKKPKMKITMKRMIKMRKKRSLQLSRRIN